MSKLEMVHGWLRSDNVYQRTFAAVLIVYGGTALLKWGTGIGLAKPVTIMLVFWLIFYDQIMKGGE